MKQKLVILILLLSSFSSLYAQNVRFPTSGIIEFEKNSNVFAIIKKTINKQNESYMQPQLDNYKTTKPQFKILKSTLTFSKDKILFTPAAEDLNDRDYMADNPMITQNNTIFTDLSSTTSTIQKKIFEETFLVKDSTRAINWKITSETREIAGYECRRANAIIMDSIYVVAFYTDKIPVSGGPESFSGLPGMILGVALPHENVTWFAKSIKDTPVTENQLKPPAKGKPLNKKGLTDTFKTLAKDWGDYANILIKGYSL